MTAALTLPIVIGKRYLRRDGAVVTAKKHEPGLSQDTAFVHASGDELYDAHVFINTGRSSVHLDQPRAQDLVADYVEQSSHPHAALMALYAQDAAETTEPWKRWQVNLDGHWTEPAGGISFAVTLRYRRKPKTIRIGEFEVPEPLRAPLSSGTKVYVPCFGTDSGVSAHHFSNVSPVHNGMLHQGLLHSTPEAARRHCDALLAFTIQS